MAVLVQIGKYGAINTTYTTTMGYYVTKFLSEAYTLQECTTCDGKIGAANELIYQSTVHELYARIHKLEQTKQQKNIIVLTLTIIYLCLDLMKITKSKQIPNIFYNRSKAQKALQRHPMRLTDSYHDFIFYKIKH